MNIKSTSIFSNMNLPLKFFISIEFTTVFKTTGPSKDTSNWICTCWFSLLNTNHYLNKHTIQSWFYLLMFTIVTCYSTMSSFSFNGFTIRSNKYRWHKTKTAITYSKEFFLSFEFMLIKIYLVQQYLIEHHHHSFYMPRRIHHCF